MLLPWSPCSQLPDTLCEEVDECQEFKAIMCIEMPSINEWKYTHWHVSLVPCLSYPSACMGPAHTHLKNLFVYIEESSWIVDLTVGYRHSKGTIVALFQLSIYTYAVKLLSDHFRFVQEQVPDMELTHLLSQWHLMHKLVYNVLPLLNIVALLLNVYTHL